MLHEAARLGEVELKIKRASYFAGNSFLLFSLYFDHVRLQQSIYSWLNISLLGSFNSLTVWELQS